MATILYTDGREVSVSPRNGNDFQLEELKSVVGGYIEIVGPTGLGTLPRDEIMIVNEDGLSLGLPFNANATALYGCGTIVGDVLVCKRFQVE